MPANLTPEYRAAEAAYRKAGDPRDRLTHLREMLRVIPKHKGTEHLRAELKTRIKELTAELASAPKAGARTGPPTYIAPEGAAQISLLGPPNSGKSTLHDALTGSHSEVGPYPFTTQYPHPGMYVHREIPFQLVDLPPISREHPVPWMVNALQPADAALLVVDVAEPGCVELVVTARDLLADRNIVLTPTWPGDGAPAEPGDEHTFVIELPTLLVIAKRDLAPGWRDELEALNELAGIDYPALAVSAVSGEGLDGIGSFLARKLEILRVYTKIPGQPPDMTRPFTVRRGQTVADVARLVHRDMAESVRYARVWGSDSFDGQQVGRDHPVADGDVIELHA